MDDLIAKMRSQVAQPQEPTETKDYNEVVDAHKETKEIYDLTTSQPDVILLNRFKLDFENLNKYRGSDNVKVSEVKESDVLKIEGPMWAIIKSIETYKGSEANVYKWELCDESGAIFGSSIVNDSEISVGTIVCLTNFSLWKINGNHINIVHRNIKQVVNEGQL